MKKIFNAIALLAVCSSLQGCINKGNEAQESIFCLDEEVFPGSIMQENVLDRLFSVQDYQLVTNHWESVNKGDGGTYEVYLFNADSRLNRLSKSDDKSPEWDGFSYSLSDWTLGKNGETMTLDGTSYTVYPDLPSRIFLKSGSKLICLQEVPSSQQDYFREKLLSGIDK